MNKKEGVKVTTANECCWERRARRWGTWKRLVNASEISQPQKGNNTCFHTAHGLWRLIFSLCSVCVFMVYLNWCKHLKLHISCSSFLIVPHYPMWCTLLTKSFSKRPPSQLAAWSVPTAQDDLWLVTRTGQGCELGCLCGASVILLGMFGVRHILLRSPPPLLVHLRVNSPYSLLSLNITWKQIAHKVTTSSTSFSQIFIIFEGIFFSHMFLPRNFILRTIKLLQNSLESILRETIYS